MSKSKGDKDEKPQKVSGASVGIVSGSWTRVGRPPRVRVGNSFRTFAGDGPAHRLAAPLPPRAPLPAPPRSLPARPRARPPLPRLPAPLPQDLGTTYSCVGVWQHDRVEIIANDQGNRTTPSYVAFTDAERLVGDAAKNQAAMNPINTVFDAKRLIGRKFDDAIVQGDMKLWPFKVVKGVAGKPMVQVDYKGEVKVFAAEEISAMVLQKMKGAFLFTQLGRSLPRRLLIPPHSLPPLLFPDRHRAGLPGHRGEERRDHRARLL